MAAIDCVLIRHGEPECPPDIFLGHTNPPLSALGSRQIHNTCNWLRQQWPDFQPAQIYTSQLQRAIDSAEVVRDQFPLTIERTELLNEIFFGEWEGQAFDDIEKDFPGALATWLGDPLTPVAPGGEDFHNMAERIDAFLEEEQYSPCIIVAHYCSIAVLASRLLDVSLLYADRMALQRGSCGRIRDGHLIGWGMPPHD